MWRRRTTSANSMAAPSRRGPALRRPGLPTLCAVPKLQLLPAVDVADGQAVRLVQGEAGSETSYGDPLEAAVAWQQAGAEWIHLVNLDAAALENPDWTARVIAEHGEKIAVGLDVRGTTLAARGWTSEGGDLWE